MRLKKRDINHLRRNFFSSNVIQLNFLLQQENFYPLARAFKEKAAVAAKMTTMTASETGKEIV